MCIYSIASSLDKWINWTIEQCDNWIYLINQSKAVMYIWLTDMHKFSRMADRSENLTMSDFCFHGLINTSHHQYHDMM